MTQPAFGQILNFKIRLNKIKTKGYWKLHQNTWYYCPIGFRYFLDQLRQFLPHIINGNILYMKTFVNHVLVFHILVSIAIITKCKYVERDKESRVLIEGVLNRVWLYIYIYFSFSFSSGNWCAEVFWRVGWVFLGIFAEFFLPTWVLHQCMIHGSSHTYWLLDEAFRR